MVKTFAAIPLPTRISIGASGKRGLRARQFLVRVYRSSVTAWTRTEPGWIMLVPATLYSLGLFRF